MLWLDEARINDIFNKLGLDNPPCEDSQVEHNHPGHSSRAEPGGAEDWDALAKSADTVTFPIFAIDHDHRVIVWNRAMETLTGVTTIEILGKGDYAYAMPFYGTERPMLIDYVLIPPDLEKIFVPVSMIQAGETYTGEVEEVQVNGRPLRMQGRATRICDTEGRVIAAIQSIGILHPVNAQDVVGTVGKNRPQCRNPRSQSRGSSASPGNTGEQYRGTPFRGNARWGGILPKKTDGGAHSLRPAQSDRR